MPAYVAKGSLKNIPVIGLSYRIMNFIFVERNKKTPAIKPTIETADNAISVASPPDNKRHSLSVGEQICRRQRMEGNTPIVRTY